MAGAVAAIAVHHQQFEGGGLLGVALHGGMPMLQQPDIIIEVGLGAGDFLGVDAANRAMDRELQGIISEPDDLPGLGGGEKAVVAHSRMQAPAGSSNDDGMAWKEAAIVRKAAGDKSSFPAGFKVFP